MPRTVLIVAYSLPPVARVGGMRIARFIRYLNDWGWRAVTVAPATDSAVGDKIDPTLNRFLPDDAVVRRADLWPPFRWMLRRFSVGDPGGDAAASSSRSDNDRASRGAGSSSGVRARMRQAMRGAKRLASMPFTTPDKRILWVPAAIREGLRAVREFQPEVILTSGPPHSIHLVGLALKRATGVPWVSDFRDPWARSKAETHAEPAYRRWSNDRLERWCVKRSDRVILNTPAARAEFEAFYGATFSEKLVSIPNGYDPALREQIEALVTAHRRPQDADSVRLCHAGSVYGRRDIRPLIDAVALVNGRGRRVVFEQVGPLDKPGEIAACIERNDAGGFIQLLGQRPHEEALHRQAVADILVVVRQNTPLQVPAKLYEMMLFGKPLLVLDGEGAMTRLVREYDLGVVADPENPVAIAAAIEEVIGRIGEAPSERRAAALVKFDARTQTRELADVLAAAVESRRRSRR